MSTDTISLKERQALITALPCFSMFSAKESHELAKLMTEMSCAAGITIVVEGELIDRVYIVISGQAEVVHRLVVKKALKKPKTINTPLAVIGPGDAIGLNDTGFFSDTGMRTATVISLIDMKLLTIDLKTLHEFLKANPKLQAEMYATATHMLRVRLIKQSLPFVRLSYNRIQWLARHVEELVVAAGAVIFSQGEAGESCYLIRSGKIEIVMTDENDNERRLALLRPPTLFGEATLITHDPRNATARAVENSELLVLKHKYLSELIETEDNVANMFMTLMVDRSRPEQNPHVTEHHRNTADGQEVVILKNPDNGIYFKLSQEGLYVWKQLNGKQTIQELTLGLSDKFNTFAPDVVVGLISKLANAGFVKHVETNDAATRKGLSFMGKIMAHLRRLLEFRYAFGDADKWLTKAYRKGVNKIFTRMGKLLFATIAICGFITFFVTTNETIETFKLMPNVWWLFAGLVPATILSVALHELGHAFAAKSYGHEVHYMGVGWFWVSPVAFTDTSDMWLAARGPRIMVNLAGVCMDSLVAGVCSLLILVIANPYIQAFLWMFALYTYINAFRMLSPLQELDGYYVLMDVVEKPHLRQAAVTWLIKGLPKAIRNPKLFRKNLPEISYWAACIVFLLLVTILTLLVQTFVFDIIGFHSNRYITLSLPFIVAIISMLGLIADVRKQSD